MTLCNKVQGHLDQSKPLAILVRTTVRFVEILNVKILRVPEKC